jgi:hypothetical protein
MVRSVYWSSCTVLPLYLQDFNYTYIFWTYFRKIPKYWISRKSIQWERSSMRTDGQTEMTKVVVVLRNFLNAHQNRCLFSDPHKTHKYSCGGRTWNLLLLNLVVRIVTIGLCGVNAYHLVWKASNYGDVWKDFTGGSSALQRWTCRSLERTDILWAYTLSV